MLTAFIIRAVEVIIPEILVNTYQITSTNNPELSLLQPTKFKFQHKLPSMHLQHLLCVFSVVIYCIMIFIFTFDG